MCMAKRKSTATEKAAGKRKRVSTTFTPIKVATEEASVAVDRYPPLLCLNEAITSMGKLKPRQGESVVYWMRMADLRLRDNRALSKASECANKSGIPLIAIFILSPQDYIAHDTGARKIDFTLRNLALLKKSFSDLHIPFHITVCGRRKAIPSFILSFCKTYWARSLFANIEYELDELNRDIELCNLADLQRVHIDLSHDKGMEEPWRIYTGRGKCISYAVFENYWRTGLNTRLHRLPEECPPSPKPNNNDCRLSEKIAPLFDTPIPEKLEGFELEDDDKMRMCDIWPAGEDVALKILEEFLSMKAHPSQHEDMSLLAAGAEKSYKGCQILRYDQDKDRLDRDATSRLSPYLSSGVISARQCLLLTMQVFNLRTMDSAREPGIRSWFKALALREFHTYILAFFPRVCMGRPFNKDYSNIVREGPQVSSFGREQTEDDHEAVKRWKEGKTGVPIVDAAMRCINEIGWVHNRARVIAAMYLTKFLMIDWRIGERYFMQKLIDGDFASNNGGWQWCSSTGADPAPYFRMGNPHSQSEKVDPTGDFIQRWVPELRALKGRDLHNPPPSIAETIGYPLPMISLNEARERVLRRYGKPGTE